MRAARSVLLATASAALAALALASPGASGRVPSAIQTSTYTWAQPAFVVGSTPAPPAAVQSAPAWQTPTWIG